MLIDSRHVLGSAPLLGAEDCLPGQTNYQNRLVVIRSELMHPDSRFAECQYFYAMHGFGCEPDSPGTKLYGYFLVDGADAFLERNVILGAADPKKLPRWAAERLAEIQAPKMTVRIFQVDHEKDANRLAYESLKDLPENKPDASMYRQVYGRTVNCSSLDELFKICNETPPPGFCGESMSVGNVVEICEGKQAGFYFCDRAGFEKIDFDISLTDHETMLTVLVCEPNKEPYPAEIQDCLKAKQSVVGGLIEPVYFSDERVVAFCDEEFLFKDYAPNRMLGQTVIQGPFFIVGDAENEACEWIEVSLTEEQLEKYGRMFAYPLMDISDNAVAEEPEESENIGISQT